MTLKGAIDELADLITRVEHGMRPTLQVGGAGWVKHYEIKTDFVSLSDEELGELLLVNDDARKYRQCIAGIYQQVAGKAEHISRSAVASIIERAMLKALDPAQTTAEKNFSKRLSSALDDLKRELRSKPILWEAHSPVGMLADKLPYNFGRCEFYFGDSMFLHHLHQRMYGDKVPAAESDLSRRAAQDVWHIVQRLVKEKTGVFTLVNAVDATAAQLLAGKRIRQTADILNFFANLGGQAPSQVLLPEDARPAVAETFLFSKEQPVRETGSQLVGPLAPFSFGGPHLHQAGLARISEILEKQAPSKFEDGVIKAFQWAGKASVEPRKEEAFLLFAISLESLLLRKNDKEITETLALRLAHLISGPKTRLIVYRDMKRLYEIRSGIVHSGSVDVGEDQLSEIRYYTRLALLTMLCDSRFSGITKHDDLVDWFRARLLDAPQDSQPR